MMNLMFKDDANYMDTMMKMILDRSYRETFFCYSGGVFMQKPTDIPSKGYAAVWYEVLLQVELVVIRLLLLLSFRV